MLHKHECTQAAAAAGGGGGGGGGGGAAAAAAPPPPAALQEAGTSVFQEVAEGEEVILHSLISKHELNGCAAVISGKLAENGRYQAKVRSPSGEVVVAIKPDNFLRLGVRVEHAKVGEGGHAGGGCGGDAVRRVLCSAHASESCIVCCVDLVITNHLLSSWLSRQRAPRLSLDDVKRIADAHFAKAQAPREVAESTSGELRCLGDSVVEGLPNEQRRAVMRAALKIQQPSLAVAASVAGMACFAARHLVVAQPEAVQHLARVLRLCGALQDSGNDTTPVPSAESQGADVVGGGLSGGLRYADVC